MMNADELPDPDDTIPDEIRHAVLIRSSRQECYRILTTAEGWNSWFTTSMFIDLKVGGVLVFEWKNWGADNLSTGDHGVIVDLEEGKKLSFTWHPDKPDHATRVDLSLEDNPEGCVVRVCEMVLWTIPKECTPCCKVLSVGGSPDAFKNVPGARDPVLAGINPSH